MDNERHVLESREVVVKTYGPFVSEGGEVSKETMDHLGKILKKQGEETAKVIKNP